MPLFEKSAEDLFPDSCKTAQVVTNGNNTYKVYAPDVTSVALPGVLYHTPRKEIVGIRKPDEKHLAMTRIAKDCAKLGIQIPQQVMNYFLGEAPGDIVLYTGLGQECVTEFANFDHGITSTGFEVILGKVPPNIEKIRFTSKY